MSLSFEFSIVFFFAKKFWCVTAVQVAWTLLQRCASADAKSTTSELRKSTVFFRVTKEAPSERPLPCGCGDDRGSWRRKMQRCNACGVGIAMELGDGDGDMMEIS